MPYRIQYYLAIALTLASVAIQLTVSQNEALGLTRQIIAILGIVGGVISAALAFLPRVQAVPNPTREGLD